VENLKIFIDSIWKLKRHKRPIVLMGHSMGGLVVARFQETYPEYADALIAVSPMWGIQEPADVPPGMLRALGDFYVAAGLGELCARADGIDPITFAAIALCHQDPTLNACFNEPSNPMCASLTMCLLQGMPNDCGMPPIDFAGLNALFQSFYTMAPGCHTMPDPVSVCSPDSPEFYGGTTDFEYCLYSESHPLAGPDPTFGWISASFAGIDDLMENLSRIEAPTAVFSSPIDMVVPPESHVTVCDALSDCTYVPFISDPDAGNYYLHHLLASSDKATTVGAVQAYLETLLKTL
jgi:pimeloyl-ACP methyl ester carboxylesterase